MINRKSTIRQAGSVAATWLLSTTWAFAADNTVDPKVEVGATYNSNLRLQPSAIHDDVAGGYVDALAAFGTQTQRTQFTLTPRVRATKYTDNQDEETTDWFVNSVLAHRAERSRYGLEADFSNQDVVTTELLSPTGGSLGTPGSGDGGIALSKNKASRIYASPSAAFTTGERSELQLSGVYSQIDYDRQVLGSQIDYSNAVGSLGWSLRTSQRLRVLAAADVTQFSPDNTGSEKSNTYGLRFETWHEQTERLSAYLRLGAIRSDVNSGSAAGRNTAQTTAIFGLGLARRLAVGQLLLQANRSVDANGTGQLLERTEAYLEWTHSLSPRTQFRLGTRAVWAAAIDNTAGYADQRYYVASAGLEWRLGRTISLTSRYDYTGQHISGAAEDPTSNAGYLGLVFEPHRRN
ncbi:MAG: hypothetical protein ABL964_01310 [Steroidobacteraceae bacterium]